MRIDDNLYNIILKVMPIICVDIVIKHDSKFLLIRRNEEPAKNEWWLPGGRLYKNESLQECAIRKCKEEVGLDIHDLHKIHVASTEFDDPHKTHSVNIIYHAIANDNKVVLDLTSSEYKWVEQFSGLHPYVKTAIFEALISYQ